MIKGKKIIRNIVILVLLFILLFKRSGLYLTPLAAHESSERSIHYGPSEVMHVADFKGGKYILSKYDQWISCNTVNRILLFFWGFGDQVTGIENDKAKEVVYSFGWSDRNYKLYGIINDDKISKIQITLKNEEILTETEFYGDMFLFTWEQYDVKDIKAYDSSDHIIFEYKH